MKNSGTSLLMLLFTISLITIRVRAQNSTDLTNQTTTSQKLRFVVPVRELNEFAKFRSLRDDGGYNFSGFSIEVFRAVAEIAIPSLDYELVPFINPDGTMRGTFDDMLDAVQNEEFDGAVGDITILFYRMQRVDFTIPYLESDIGLLVRLPTTYTKKESLTPATMIILVLAAILAFAILVAVVIWIWKLCKYNRTLPLTQSSRLNDNFKIPTSGSTTDTRLMIILVLMVLLLAIASYMPPITPTTVPVQSLVDDIKNLDDLKRKDAKVGYRQGAFVKNILLSKGGLSESQIVELHSDVEMVDKLQKGGEEGGVDALVAGTDYLKLFQSKDCNQFTLIPTFRLPSAGYAFAFPKDQSPSLVNRFSEAIVRLIDNEEITKIQARTIGNLDNVCPHTTVSVTSSLQDRISLWLPVASAIFVVVLVIVMLLSYCGRSCMN